MPNQHDNRVDPAILSTYLQIGALRGQIEEAYQFSEERPLMCVLQDTDHVYFRYLGKRYKISRRALVYYRAYGDAPVLLPCTCKHWGCINHRHQRQSTKGAA